MTLAPTKTQVIQIGSNNLRADYNTNQAAVQKSDTIRDLGVHITNKLDWSAHCSEVAKTAGIRASTKSIATYAKAFKFLVCPILKYGSVVWSPYYIKDVNLIENIQRTYTRRVFAKCGLAPRSYPERLSVMGLTTLEEREVDTRFRGPSENMLQPLINPRKVPAINCWSNRVAPLWNALPQDVVNSPSIATFKKSLRDIGVYNDLSAISKIRD